MSIKALWRIRIRGVAANFSQFFAANFPTRPWGGKSCWKAWKFSLECFHRFILYLLYGTYQYGTYWLSKIFTNIAELNENKYRLRCRQAHGNFQRKCDIDIHALMPAGKSKNFQLIFTEFSLWRHARGWGSCFPVPPPSYATDSDSDMGPWMKSGIFVRVLLPFRHK